MKGEDGPTPGVWSTCLALLLVVSAPTGDLIPEGNATEVEIVALYPNTVHAGNHGEFIVVHVPDRRSVRNWTFRDDGVQSAKPPPVTVNGTVAFSHHPAKAAVYLDMPVYELEGWLQLAVDGEAVTLEVDGAPVDAVGYDGPAPRAHLWVRDRPDPWVPLAATAFAPVSDRADARAFVLPDAPAAVIGALEGAEDRLLLGGYELGDAAVVDALIAAHERGVTVAVHAEGRPVGGVSVAHGAALDALDDAGVPVTVHRGPYARYGFHHPKYAVIDDRVLVTTENFKATGTGGRASRGWGTVVASAALADAAAEVFDADTGWRDAVAWSAVRDEVNRFPDDGAGAAYPTAHPPVDHRAVNATLLVAPDNAEAAMVELIAGARDSIHVKQVAIADADFPLLAGAVDRARDGVSVRILLSDRWYVRDENRALAAELEALADDEGLDLEVALVDDTPRFDRVHAKGVVVDGHTAVVGSINWNNHSIRQNREVAVVLEHPAVAAYYIAVFEGDWPGDGAERWRVPVGLVLAALAAGGLVALHARQLRFEEPAVERSTGGPD